MSREYADYLKTHSGDSVSEKKDGGIEDWSRPVLLALLGLAALMGYFVNTHINKPERVVNSSVSKTLNKNFTASVEGKTALRDSLIAVYRSWETSHPNRELSMKLSPESDPAPMNSREALELIRTASRIAELDREDMYGHPTRHFYGELECGSGGSNQPDSYYFEYWADMRNLAAVRLVMTGVRRDIAVNAKGDSVSSETLLNIRYVY